MAHEMATRLARDYDDTVLWFRLADGAIHPSKANNLASGIDVYSRVSVTLVPNIPTRIDVGVSARPPPGTHLEVKERSGLAFLNICLGAGVIDQDYTGTLNILVTNRGQSEYTIKVGDKIAQAVQRQDLATPIKYVDRLPETHRGDRGFGSTDNQTLGDEPVNKFNAFTGDITPGATFYDYDTRMDEVASAVFGRVPGATEYLCFSTTYIQTKLAFKDGIFKAHTDNWQDLGYESLEKAKCAAMSLIAKKIKGARLFSDAGGDEHNTQKKDSDAVEKN